MRRPTTTPPPGADPERRLSPRPSRPRPTRATDRAAGRPQVVDTIATGLDGALGAGVPARRRRGRHRARHGQVLLISGTAPYDVTELGTDRARRAPQGEGGLLGVAVSPDFDQRPDCSTSTSAPPTTTGSSRATLDERPAGRPEPILDGIPHGLDPRRRPARVRARRLPLRRPPARPATRRSPRTGTRLAGKILRITPDGEPGAGQPVPDSPIWSWGHRNVQGLAFDDDGPAVGLGVRAGHLRRAQPDRRRAPTTAGPRSRARAAPSRLRRPAGRLGHRRGLAVRAGVRRRRALAWPRCAASGSGGSTSTGRRRRPAGGLLRRRVRPDAHRRRRPRRLAVGDDLQPRRPRAHPRPSDDRILRSCPSPWRPSGRPVARVATRGAAWRGPPGRAPRSRSRW